MAIPKPGFRLRGVGKVLTLIRNIPAVVGSVGGFSQGKPVTPGFRGAAISDLRAAALPIIADRVRHRRDYCCYVAIGS